MTSTNPHHPATRKRGGNPDVKPKAKHEKPDDVLERKLEEGLEESMAGSDPISITQPRLGIQTRTNPMSAIITETRSMTSIGRRSANREPTRRPMAMPPVTVASDAAAAAGPKDARSRRRSALQKTTENSVPRKQMIRAKVQ